MKRIVLFCIAALAAATLAACAKTTASGAYNQNFDFGKLDRVAVIKVVGPFRNQGQPNQIATLMNQFLLQKGFSPVERQQIVEVLAETEFQDSQITTANGAASFGKVLNVDAVILANIPKFGSEMSMSTQMIDVQTGSILWSATGTARTGEALGTAAGAILGAVVAAGASSALGGGSSTNTLSGLAGGAAGGIAGQALAPQREEQVAKLLAKLFESFPSKFSQASIAGS